MTWRRAVARHRLALLFTTLLVFGAGPARGGNRLQEITDSWRKTRAHDVPIASYLRGLVRTDSAFAVDSTLSVAKLGARMRREYAAMDPLFSPELRLQFLGLSSDSLRAEWLRCYWRLRDPTPTTPENERKDVHDQRVATARERFALKKGDGWDDRGNVWIAFGEPDSVIEDLPDVKEGIGFVPAKLEWLYLNEKWVVDFERPNPRGPWKLGSSSARLSYRPDLVQRDRIQLGYVGVAPDERGASYYERLGDVMGQQDEREILALAIDHGDVDERAESDIASFNIRTDLRAKHLLEKKQEGQIRFRHEYEHGGERFSLPGTAPPSLWFVFDVDVFKGPPGRMRVEVHYQLNMQDLRFGWADSVYTASYRAEGVLLDRNAREAAHDDYTEKLTASDFRTTLAAQLIPGQLDFDVPEGGYRLALRLVDPASRAERVYTTHVEVPNLDGRSLALSDVQIASSIVYAGDDWKSRFVKKDRLVVPNPIGAYAHGKPLTGYFEIYGLGTDPRGHCRYEVRYAIAPRSVARPQGVLPGTVVADRPFVTSSFKNESISSEVVEELRVDVKSLVADTYDLVLTVHDLVSGTETTSRTAFSILN